MIVIKNLILLLICFGCCTYGHTQKIYQAKTHSEPLILKPIDTLSLGVDVKHFDYEEGLNSESIIALNVDSKGYIWVGTQDNGFYKFNGEKFQHFHYSMGYGGLNASQILEDSKGNIYTFSSNGSAKINESSLLNYPIDYPGVAAATITDLDNVFCSSVGGKIYKLENDSMILKKDLNEDGGFTENNYTINKFIGYHGNLYVIYNEVIHILNEKTLETVDKIIFESNVYDFCIVQNVAYMRFGQAGILTIDLDNNWKQKWIHQDIVPHTIMHSNSSDQLIVFAKKYKSTIVETGLITFVNQNHMLGNSASKFDVEYDHQGNIWFGTSTGLYRVTKKDSKLVSDYHEINLETNGKFIGSDNGAMALINHDKNLFYIKDKLIYNLDFNSFGVTLFFDHRDNLWVFGRKQMSNSEVINKKESQTRITKFDFQKNKVFYFDGPNNYFFYGTSPIAERNDSLFFQVRNEDSNAIVSLHDGLFSEIANLTHTPQSIAIDDDNIYLGMNGHHLWIWNGSEFIKKKKGISNNSIRHIEKFGKKLFLSTWGEYFEFDLENDSAITYSMAHHKLPSWQIASSRIDNDSVFWIATAQGIAVKKYNDSVFTTLSAMDGVPPKSYQSTFEDGDGNIWACQKKGIHIFKKEARIGVNPPIVYIKDVQVNYVSIVDSNTTFHNYNDSVFNFTYDQNNVSITIDAIEFSNPENVLISYKLFPLMDQWSSPSGSKVINFTGLPSGNYHLEIRVTNDPKSEEFTNVKLDFSIAKPFWETTWFRTSSITCFIILLVSTFKARTYSLKKRQKQLENEVNIKTKELREEKEIVEEKNKEILDSIVYAKRLQEAILPPKKLVKEWLQNSFILYKPKDIVAGDFYWLEHLDDKVLFAACDCTGHGVPGAMVSVICNNGLNRSVREYGLTDPGQILDKTREIVIQEFEKSEDEVKDGMDIALCSLEGSTLKYAGAHNPLWIIRNGEVLETKANKQPIGKFDKQTPYTSHTFELEKGDSIYIFSDGYVDQFGGEKGKKFKSKAFRSLLLSIQDKTMEEQRVLIDEAFETWRGNLEQIDDVCVIGVRI